MTETTQELLTRLTGFTPGPHQVSGGRHRGNLMIGPGTQLHMVGPDGDAVAAVFYDVKTGRGFKDAHLYAAAPDLHRIVTEQAAEIERLREALDRAAFVLSVMPDIALRVGLAGTSQWDEIAGGPDLFGALDQSRAALAAKP